MSNFEQTSDGQREVNSDGPMLLRNLDIGGIDNRRMVTMVENLKVRIGDGTRYYLENQEFETLSNRQSQNLIITRLNNLGLNGCFLTYGKIRKQAKFLGLKECPLETPMELFLNKVEAVSSEPIFVATQPIYNSEKIPFIYRVNFLDRSIMLTNTSKFGGRGWTENDQFLFMLPKEIVREVVA